jgi:hypothetical protein
MLADLNVEALLTDEILADLVWTLWHEGQIPEVLAALAWLGIAASQQDTPSQLPLSDLDGF